MRCCVLQVDYHSSASLPHFISQHSSMMLASGQSCIDYLDNTSGVTTFSRKPPLASGAAVAPGVWQENSQHVSVSCLLLAAAACTFFAHDTAGNGTAEESLHDTVHHHTQMPPNCESYLYQGRCIILQVIGRFIPLHGLHVGWQS